MPENCPLACNRGSGPPISSEKDVFPIQFEGNELAEVLQKRAKPAHSGEPALTGKLQIEDPKKIFRALCPANQHLTEGLRKRRRGPEIHGTCKVPWKTGVLLILF